MTCPFKPGDIVQYNNPEPEKFYWLKSVIGKFGIIQSDSRNSTEKMAVMFHGIKDETHSLLLRVEFMTLITDIMSEYNEALIQFGNNVRQDLNKKDTGSFGYNGTTINDLLK